MNRWDTALACSILLVTAALWTVSPVSADEAILNGPNGSTSVNLSLDATYVVAGAVGSVEFSVRDGEIVCVDSSCSDGLCQHMGPLKPGRPIVCAPNGVIARFDRPGGGLDAVSR